jgi:stress-induced morphogen
VSEIENKPLNEQESPTKEEKSSKIEKETNQLTKTTYQNGNIIIHFPQLTGMENSTKEKQVNELLKNEITQFVHQYEKDDTALDMDYEVIMETKDTLSILYTGYYNVKGGAYPSHLLFTTNIDLRTADKMRLSDLVTIDEGFVEKFKTAPYFDRENSSPNEDKVHAVKEYLNGINDSELMNAFKQADFSSATDNPYGIYSYFQGHSLVISIQVPHVIGDHAEFKLELN